MDGLNSQNENMATIQKIPVQKIKESKIAAIDFGKLEFGKYMSDHMLVAKYSNGQWSQGEIVPYGPLQLSPNMLALHYGQSVFEGMKAFRMKDGKISIFRIQKHFERLQRTLNRMCMPELPYSLFEEGLKQLIQLDQQFVPDSEGSSLYIRPLLFATEERFGVKISEEYLFVIMTGPVPPFYPKPIRVKIEDHYSRAAKGGTGTAKCAGNYGGSFYATKIAREQGFDQVLWTDLSDELNIEESGTMNVFFLINDKLITPPLSETILAGVTRDAIIALARHEGVIVEERKISAGELLTAHQTGKLQEAFGAGTAAVTAAISTIGIKGKTIELPSTDGNSLCIRLQKKMTALRTGDTPDIFKWNTIINGNNE